VSNLVIVAIPDENDRVWKVSSEKIPHLTLLFLGESDEVSNLETIVQFVEHAANTTLNRFYLPVDRRGELGNDPDLGPADVLFFKKGRYDYKAIRDFRAALLQDDNIRTAHDTAQQHDGPWMPHLTLGYEKRPAKPEDNDFGSQFYSVEFNKIAVWVDEYDGPEFLLKDFWDEYEALDSVPMDVAMSDIRSGNLEHYGVKGMRWGVRNVATAAKSAGGAVGKAASATARFAGDVSFENKVEDGRAREAVISKAGPAFRKEDLPAVKARHGDYAKLTKRATKPFAKESRAYRKDAKETYINRLETTANSMTNASGNRQYTIRERGLELPAEGGDLPRSRYYWDVSSRKVRHAAEDDFTRLEVIMDDEGWITDLKQVEIEDEMAQTADLGVEFLAHYGVKGMRWGVRNEKGGTNTSGVGEKKRTEGYQRYLDPQGHELGTDITKVGVGVLVPIVAPLTWPAQIRLIRGGARGIKAKALDRQEKKFEKNAMSPQNFAAIHNGAVPRVNRELEALKTKHPQPNKNAKTQKAYDDEVVKVMQGAYKESANSLTNKAMTRHLDVSFHGDDGQDVKIHAVQGPPKPMLERVKHADGEDEIITVEITGKVKRDTAGHILGFELDGFKNGSLAQSAVDIGATLVSSLLSGEDALAHYGVKGMRWGVRREPPSAVAPTAQSVVPHGSRRQTKIKVDGGENQPAHSDAVKVAQARAKLGKSGAAALSNAELREVANRLQLEQQVKQLTTGGGKKFVTNILRSEGQQGSQKLLRKGVKGARKAALGV
jgi:2'-5' RNA ligase